MIQSSDMTIDYIYNNELDEEMQKNISFLKTCLEKRELFRNKGIFNIFIEDMSRRKIQTFLEYANLLFINKDISDRIIPISRMREISNYQNEVLFLPIDDMDDFHSEWNNSSSDILKAFKKACDLNNILIVATIKPFCEYSSLEKSDISKIAPAFHFHVHKDLDSIYQKLVNCFKDNNISFALSYEEFETIYDSIQSNEYVLQFDIDEYLYNYAISSNQYYEENIVTINTYSNLLDEDLSVNKEMEEENVIDLKHLTGLKNVKSELNALFHYASFLRNMKIGKDGTYLNMFFLGNPGTGKTMVASIIANKLYELGYLNSKEIVKVIPTDLIGEYVGHTKKVMRTILNSAKGKLLFIDEAYLIGY